MDTRRTQTHRKHLTDYGQAVLSNRSGIRRRRAARPAGASQPTAKQSIENPDHTSNQSTGGKHGTGTPGGRKVASKGQGVPVQEETRRRREERRRRGCEVEAGFWARVGAYRCRGGSANPSLDGRYLTVSPFLSRK